MKRTFFCLLGLLISIQIYGLTKAQKWELALTEIITVVNGDSHDTLNFGELNEKNKAKYSEWLKRDWSITNKEELLSTLADMEVDGHAVVLEKMQKIINDTDNYSIFNIVNKYKLSSRHYNYLKFTIANWSIYKNRSIKVWDWGRNISLCRWGYDCGYLSEEEAWERITYYAKKIQPLYKNWIDYGFDYYMGRVFWASGFGEDISYLYKTDKIYQELISNDGYWASLEWNIDLDSIE